MKLTYLPLLKVQRDLYMMPRGIERFRAYLSTMTNQDSNDLKLPLVGMNPMGKDHLLPFLDDLIALDADAIAAQTTAEVEQERQTTPGSFQISLVVSDDALGGWTNRYVSECNIRCGEREYHKRGWATVTLWTSETYTAEQLRNEVRLALYRLAYIQAHGYPANLRALLAQEGIVMRQTGLHAPTLEADDIEYTREVLAEYLDRNDQPTVIVALFGDVAARELGFPPLGLSPSAGLALALYEAQNKNRSGCY